MERTFYQVYLPHGALVSIQSCPARQPLPFLLDPLPMLSKSASWQGSSCSEFSHHSLLIPAAHECMSSHWCMSRGSAPERLCTFAPSSIELQGHPNSPGLWRISGKKKSGVWVVQVCKEKFRLKSAVLKCGPFGNCSRWLEADPSLFSLLHFWQCDLLGCWSFPFLWPESS